MIPSEYDRAYVVELFDALGKEGRHAYQTVQIPVDMIYPLLFAISYTLLFAYFLKKINRFKNPFIYLTLLPLVSGVSDYAENIGIIVMLKSYPQLTHSFRRPILSP